MFLNSVKTCNKKGEGDKYVVVKVVANFKV